MGVIACAPVASLFPCVLCTPQCLQGRWRWPGGGVNKRASVGVQCSGQSPYMKMAHVGSLLAGGLSRQSRGGVALSDCWEEEVLCYLPIDREAIKGSFSLSPHSSIATSVAKAGA